MVTKPKDNANSLAAGSVDQSAAEALDAAPDNLRARISPVLMGASWDVRALAEALVSDVIVPTAVVTKKPARDYRDEVIAKAVEFNGDDITFTFTLKPDAQLERGLQDEHRAAAEQAIEAYKDAAQKTLEEMGLHVSRSDKGIVVSGSELTTQLRSVVLTSPDERQAAVQDFWEMREQAVGPHTADILRQGGIGIGVGTTRGSK